MPIVPTDNSFNVAPQALPGVRITSDANAADFGGIQAKQVSDVGQGLETVGSDLSAIQSNVQARQNTDAVFRTESQFKADAGAFLAEQRQRKGVQAWDLTKDTQKWFDENAAKYADGLENDAQRQTFARTYASVRSQGVISSSVQEANERRASLEESAKASIAGSINLAATNYATPGAVGDAVDDITKRTAAVAQLNGWTPERASLEASNNLTSLHMQVLQNMVQTDPESAQRYLDYYGGQIAGTQKDAAAKLIRGAKFTTASQNFADGVTASNMSEADAITAARQQFKGPEQEQVVLEVKTRYQERSKAREDMQRDAADTAYGIYARTGRISAIPQAVKDQLDGRVLIALQHDAQAKAEGQAVKTDPTTFYGLRTMAAQDPDTFAKTDLRAYFGKLSEPAREQFIDLQQQVSKPKGQADVASLGSQLTTTHESLGWGGDEGSLKKKGAFDQAVMRQLDVEQSQAKRPLTFDERQKVIDRYAIERNNSWSQFGDQRFYEVAGTPDAAKFVPKVSDTDRATIVANLKSKGVANPTDDQISTVYRRWKGL